MFFDLNLPIDALPIPKKSKGKAPQQANVEYTPAQISDIEARIDLLIHCKL